MSNDNDWEGRHPCLSQKTANRKAQPSQCKPSPSAKEPPLIMNYALRTPCQAPADYELCIVHYE